MAYAKLVGQAVARAFKAAKDLAVPGTVTPPASMGYNFATDSSGAGASSPCRVIFLAAKRKGREADNSAKNALVELDRELTPADVITVDAVRWRVSQVLQSFKSIHYVELRVAT